MAKLPKGLDQTSSGRYRARVYFADRQQSIGTFDTITDAKAALSIARSEIARGTFVPLRERRARALEQQAAQAQSSVTVDEVAEKYWTFLESSGKAHGTIYTYQSRYRTHIAPAFGDTPITSVTAGDIETWYSRLNSTKGQGVARSTYLTLSSLFSYAAGTAHGLSSSFEAYIDVSPVQVSGATKHKPKHRDSEPVASVEQINFIAEHVPDRYRLSILLAAWTAVRLGEIIGLQRGDLTTNRGQTWLSISRQVQARGEGLYETAPKSEAGIRSVPVPEALHPIVTEHFARHVGKPKSALLFPRADRGTKWTPPNTLRNHFNNAVEAWNADHPGDTLDHFTFHGLRHTALTRVGQAGATLEELKRYAGHSSAEVVAKYQHATRDRLAMLAGTLSSEIEAAK